MILTIPLAHDFSCPWCWIALHQIERLKKEYPIQIEWRSYELWPKDLERPPSVPRAVNPLMPKVPSRLDLMLALERLELPAVERPQRMSTHNAHLAAQFAQANGYGEPYILALYHAHWNEGQSLEEVEYLVTLAEPFHLDADRMRRSILTEEFADRIVPFDAPAYKSGVFHVPTFIIDGKPYAEQPYHVLEAAVAEAVSKARA